jgi:hypothetical protein
MRAALALSARAGLLTGLLLASVGCSSIASRLYESDGCGERHAKCLKGIPTTLDVPTHVKVAIVETQYVRKDGDVYVAGETFGMARTRRLDYDLVTMKELYTVDFKRPAAGKNDLKLTFAEGVSGGQYFSKIEHKVEDVTIDKVTALIQAVITASPTLASLRKVQPRSDPTPPQVIAVPRVIAVEFFDIRHPDLAGQIQMFLEHHVNACSPCPAVGAPPGCPPGTPVIPPVCPPGTPIAPPVTPVVPVTPVTPVVPVTPVAPPPEKPQ